MDENNMNGFGNTDEDEDFGGTTVLTSPGVNAFSNAQTGAQNVNPGQPEQQGQYGGFGQFQQAGQPDQQNQYGGFNQFQQAGQPGQYGGFAQQPYGQPGQPFGVPQGSDMQPGKKLNKKFIAVIGGIVAVAIVVVIVLIILLSGGIGLNSGS